MQANLTEAIHDRKRRIAENYLAQSFSPSDKELRERYRLYLLNFKKARYALSYEMWKIQNA